MKKTPCTHASFAALYIASLVSGVYVISTFAGDTETLLIPMAVLSLLVVSVALMGYFFISEPLMLAIEGKRQESVGFFFRTIGYFVCYVAFFGVMALSLSFL